MTWFLAGFVTEERGMHSRIVLAAVAATLAGAIACGSGSEPPPAAAPAAAPVDPATAASITGRVVVQGTVPKPEPIVMEGDPVCASGAAGAQMTEVIVVGADNGLENAFVYVKSGLGGRAFPPPATPVVLDQQGCRYHPHVAGVQVGQPLEILNSDDTLHNVHAVAQFNEEFNLGQPMKGMKSTRTFTKPEVMILFKCDVHGWMNAYVGVVDHPYFAVSAGGGRFALNTLPPGTYEIEVWHENLGTQVQTVTVGAKDTKAITFTFTIP
jgi:plastocyanin